MIRNIFFISFGVLILIFVWFAPTKTHAEVITFGSGSTPDNQNYGTITDSQRFAEPFTPGGDANTITPIFYVHKTGSPTDYARVSIYSDSGGVPGSLLASSDILGSSMGTSCSAQVFDDISLSVYSGTQYWVVFERTSTLDNTNAYTACLDDTTTIKQFNGSWANYAFGWVVGSLTLSTSGGGGGGGGSTTEGTSTVDQTEQNLWNAYWSIMITAAFVIWLFRKH